MDAKNLLIIMSDQHNRSVLGCYGHEIVRTPNLDRLAAGGTRFTDAYTPSPVCVPARAAFATGKYVHQIGAWDNAIAYDGTVPSWHHLLRERGHQVVAIGKLHFRSKDDDNGFSDEQIGMHIFEGQGDLLGLVRDEDMPKRGGSYKMAKLAGPGESMYTTYDREIAARAQVWLREEAQKHTGKPWVLFVCSCVRISRSRRRLSIFIAIGTKNFRYRSAMSAGMSGCIRFWKITANPLPTTNSSKHRRW